MMRTLLMMLALSALLTVQAHAAELENALGVPELEAAVPAEAKEALGGADPLDPAPEGTLERLLEYVRLRFSATLSEVLHPLTGVIAICLLAGVGESFATGGEKGQHAVALGSCLGIAVLGGEDVRSVLSMGRETLTGLLDFSRALLSTLAAAVAAGGGVGRAGAAYAASALFSDLLLSAANGILFPVICAFVALASAEAVMGDGRLTGAVGFLRWFARSMMRALAAAFTAYLALTGILASATDAAAVKAAKSVISTALPVVGKLMADASEALVAGIGMVRSAVGVYGLLTCLAVVLIPVMRLGLRCLLFRAAAALCSGIARPRQTRLIASLADAYGMLLGLVGTAAVIAFFSIIYLIRTVTP